MPTVRSSRISQDPPGLYSPLVPTVVVASYKGGAGKTALAVPIAVASPPSCRGAAAQEYAGMDREIVFSGVTALAAAIRVGQVSATEVLDAHLTQIARHQVDGLVDGLVRDALAQVFRVHALESACDLFG